MVQVSVLHLGGVDRKQRNRGAILQGRRAKCFRKQRVSPLLGAHGWSRPELDGPIVVAGVPGLDVEKSTFLRTGGVDEKASIF